MSKKRKKGKWLNLDAYATKIFLDVFAALEKERIRETVRRIKEKRKMKIPASVMKALDKSSRERTKK